MKLADIFRQARELDERVTAAGAADERDLAQAQELITQFVDELEILEETATVKPYLLGDAVADKVLGWWYKDGQSE